MYGLSISRVLLMIVVTLCVSSSFVSARRRRIDCRRFVFAPRCRGVAAKRSEPMATAASLQDTSFSQSAWPEVVEAPEAEVTRSLDDDRMWLLVRELSQKLRRQTEPTEASETKGLLDRLYQR